MKITKAVIPAAGLGTRFLPFTKAVPKEMLPIIDTPTIDLIIQEAVDAGIEDILIILGRGKGAIEDYFDTNFELESKLKTSHKDDELALVQSLNHRANIHFVRQHEALGLGHAVSCAATFVGNEPFLLLLGDELIDFKDNASQSLITMYEEKERTVLGLLEVPYDQTSKYGIVAIDGEHITAMVEKPNLDDAPSNLAIIGRYVISPNIFPILEQIQPGKGGEIQLTDALVELSKTEAIYGKVITGERFDTGSKIGYLKAVVSYGLQRPELREAFTSYLRQLNLNEDSATK
ncbi:UTP--glucose-1-phosphate uridylyltransferase GalU [Peptoniphilus equinus]|uniref:UTP--glucose-1-phosphate uridylyltransferase n=1 Tax=Peptoniphilus equinus TaxID=3016343 RepID=A0ABY7QR65_9FIRM|nr:UTP--glucose-1-phosphate uridylyltransferase GalU [Peptoniphilus equinus]WBW49279.1 UTP--glucose-1-phosphate uridylyltransferase GalU [Peptoniphilus equinus]